MNNGFSQPQLMLGPKTKYIACYVDENNALQVIVNEQAFDSLLESLAMLGAAVQVLSSKLLSDDPPEKKRIINPMQGPVRVG